MEIFPPLTVKEGWKVKRQINEILPSKFNNGKFYRQS